MHRLTLSSMNEMTAGVLPVKGVSLSLGIGVFACLVLVGCGSEAPEAQAPATVTVTAEPPSEPTEAEPAETSSGSFSEAEATETSDAPVEIPDRADMDDGTRIIGEGLYLEDLRDGTYGDFEDWSDDELIAAGGSACDALDELSDPNALSPRVSGAVMDTLPKMEILDATALSKIATFFICPEYGGYDE